MTLKLEIIRSYFSHNPFYLWKRSSMLASRYTGCPRRNVPNFRRVFLMLNYTDITQNTYIQSWTVTEIMAIEKCGLLGCPRIVRRPWRYTHPTAHARQQDIVMQWPWRMLYSTVALTSQDNSQLRPVWSTWKPKDKYDSIASVFVVQFNGFMSLTSYFDVKYRY